MRHNTVKHEQCVLGIFTNGADKIALVLIKLESVAAQQTDEEVEGFEFVFVFFLIVCC